MTYDAFSLTSPGSTNPITPPINVFNYFLSDGGSGGFQLTWASQANSNYNVLKCTNLTASSLVARHKYNGDRHQHDRHAIAPREK